MKEPCRHRLQGSFYLAVTDRKLAAMALIDQSKSAEALLLKQAFSRPRSEPLAGAVTMTDRVFKDAYSNIYDRTRFIGANDVAALILLNDRTRETPDSAEAAECAKLGYPCFPTTPKGIVLKYMVKSKDIVTWCQWTGGTTKMLEAITYVLINDQSSLIASALTALLGEAAIPVAWQQGLQSALYKANETVASKPWPTSDRSQVKSAIVSVAARLGGAGGQAEDIFRAIIPSVDVPVDVIPGKGNVPGNGRASWFDSSDHQAWLAVGGGLVVLGVLGFLVHRRRALEAT